MHAQLLRAFTVGKGVELLHKTQRVMGLLFHPRAQAGLQGAVIAGKGPGRQRPPGPGGQDTGLAIRDGNQHCHQIGLHGMQLGIVQTTQKRWRAKPHQGKSKFYGAQALTLNFIGSESPNLAASRRTF